MKRDGRLAQGVEKINASLKMIDQPRERYLGRVFIFQ